LIGNLFSNVPVFHVKMTNCSGVGLLFSTSASKLNRAPIGLALNHFKFKDYDAQFVAEMH
jgi:hypothetical protein